MIYYVDPSAWVKRYVDEPGTRWMRSWLATERTIATSIISYVEVLSAIARRQRDRVTPRAFEQLMDRFEADFQDFNVVRFDESVRIRAREVILSHSLRGADTIHLASAWVAYTELAHLDEVVVIVTSDAELKRAAEGARFPVLDPVSEEGEGAT